MAEENPFTKFKEQDRSTSESDNPFTRFKVDQLRPALPPVVGKPEFTPLLGIPTGRTLPPTRGEIIEARGFKIREDTPTAARLAARFGDIADIKAQLPEGTEVANLPDVGFVARNPETGQFEILNPPGLDIGDIAVEALDILPTVVEAGAGIISRNPFALALAGGAARGGILQVLKSLGIVADPNILTESALEAGLSLAGPAAAGAKRFVSAERRAVESVAAKGTPEQFAAGREEAEAIAGEVEQVGGVRPQFTTGEQLGIVEPEQAATLVGAESTLDIGQQATRSQRLAREAAQARFERGAVEPEVVEPVAERITQRQQARAVETVERVERTAEQQVREIDADLERISGNTQPVEIRSTIKESVEKSRAAISAEYDSIAESAADANIDLSGVRELSKDMLDRARLFPGGDEIFKDVLETTGFKKVPKGGLVPPSQDLNSYRAVQEARSELRAHIRGLKESKASGFEIRRAKELEREFSQSINDALADLDPELAKRLIETDFKFQSFKATVDKGFVGKLLSTREGIAVVPDETLLKTVLANTSDTTRFLNSADEFFPEIDAKNKLKDAFFTQYREKVLSGKVTHKTFMNQIKDTGDLIFSKNELKALENAGTAKNRVKSVLKKRDDRIKKIEKSFNVTIGKIEPHKLVAEISRSPKKTAQLKKILTPEEWAEYQGARRAKLVNDITDAKGNITLTGIDNVLKGSEAELRQSVGPKYVSDLKATRKFLQTLARKQSSIAGQKKDAAITGLDVTRAMIFGPLNHKSFVINKFAGLGKARTAKVLSNLLNDPDLLAERLKIFNSPERLQQERLVDFWSALGIPLVLNRGTAIPEKEAE